MVRKRFVMENLEHRLRKTRLRWFDHVKRRGENTCSLLRTAMELEEEGRRPLEDMRKLNITEDMAEDKTKKEATHITTNPRNGNLP